ncbi:MAG: T9SS type A sorting domain-containing protein [Saprospiraceae bacterium]
MKSQVLFFPNRINLAILIISLFGFSTVVANSQSNVVPAGSNASSGSGSISFSIGQIDYTSTSGSSGNLNQGLQQPYEFFIITGTDEDYIKLSTKAFPNPTNKIIYLEIDEIKSGKFNYKLFDIHSKLLESKSLYLNQTIIDMSQMISGTYLLIVYRDNGPIKTFKIIKNQ